MLKSFQLVTLLCIGTIFSGSNVLCMEDYNSEDEDSDDYGTIFIAISHHDCQTIRKILSAIGDPQKIKDLVNKPTSWAGWTMLHEACSRENGAAVETLLEFGADPNVIHHGGKTPIDYVFSQKTKQLLLEATIQHVFDIQVTDDKKLSALHIAIKHGGNCQTIRKILSAIDDPQKIKDLINKPVGWVGWGNGTMLHEACSCKNNDAVKTLLEFGAALNVRNYEGETALHSAVRSCNDDAVKLMLESLADDVSRAQFVNLKNKNGHTALNLIKMNPFYCKAGKIIMQLLSSAVALH